MFIQCIPGARALLWGGCRQSGLVANADRARLKAMPLADAALRIAYVEWHACSARLHGEGG